MRTTSLDLRERILASYDNDEGVRLEIAHRFRVSLSAVLVTTCAEAVTHQPKPA
jgi:hypothetical protein